MFAVVVPTSESIKMEGMVYPLKAGATVTTFGTLRFLGEDVDGEFATGGSDLLDVVRSSVVAMATAISESLYHPKTHIQVNNKSETHISTQ